jgi:glycerol uptake facilitator-like aquaporin
MRFSLARRVAAEFIGTAFLVAAVIGSGIMAERLSNGNIAIALLANTIATGAVLVALIFTFGDISGAHLNPIVTIMSAWERGMPWNETPRYVTAQILGGACGAIAAHGMFSASLISFSRHARSGSAQLLSEFVATFGLMSVIWGCSRLRSHGTVTKGSSQKPDMSPPEFSFLATDPSYVPFTVAAYITSAYWFTSSTSFANPAVTIARCLSDTFAGIRPSDVPWFIVAQFAGGVAATLLFRWFFSLPPDKWQGISPRDSISS